MYFNTGEFSSRAFSEPFSDAFNTLRVKIVLLEQDYSKQMEQIKITLPNFPFAATMFVMYFDRTPFDVCGLCALYSLCYPVEILAVALQRQIDHHTLCARP